jgi:arsenite methyltransferase
MPWPARRLRPNYGIDAPPGVKWVSFWAAVGFLLAILSAISALPVSPHLRQILLNVGFWIGVDCSIVAAGMVLSSRVGKIIEANKLLASIPWRGDERVLDVGCGRGLLLVGAAKRLRTGHAAGIDIWKAVDLSGNKPENTRLNAKLEGVAHRVSVISADARQLPFPDNHFDVILSNLVLHNIHGEAERRKALLEIVRTLRPGGRLIIADIFHTGEYAQAFRACGLAEVRRSGLRLLIMIPVRRVTASKPL